MNKAESFEKIAKLRNKMNEIANKFESIEQNEEYSDEYKFNFYKMDIELLLLTIEINLEACELAVDRTLKLFEDKFISTTDNFIEEETTRTINLVRKEIKEVNSIIETATS